MSDSESFKDFFGGGPAASLFLCSSNSEGELPDVLKGERPSIISPLYSLIPGWSFYSAVADMSITSFSECNLNNIFTDVITKQVYKKDEQGPDKLVDPALEHYLSNSFEMGGTLNMNLLCRMVRDNDAPVVEVKKQEFNDILDKFCMRDVIELDSPEVWHYIDIMLQLICTKQYMKPTDLVDLTVALFDYNNATELLAAGISTPHEQNAEFLGFNLVKSSISDIRFDNAKSSSVHFMMELEFARPYSDYKFSSANFM